MPGSVSYVWAGGVTPTTAVVKAVTTGVASARLRRSAAADLSAPTFTAPVVPDAQGVARFDLTGLTADQRYYYGIEIDGVLDAKVGTFQTFPVAGTPASFAFEFMACTNSYQDCLAFDAMSARAAAGGSRFLVHQGDLHYDNLVSTDPAAYSAAIQHQLVLPKYGALGRAQAWTYVPDDHDAAGGDNNDGTAAGQPAKITAYQQVVPSYPLPSTDHLGQSWRFGRVFFIISDLRSTRSPDSTADGPTKSMMGAAQKTWFKAQIAAAAADPTVALIVWCSPDQWLTEGNAEGVNADTWHGFTQERRELADHFASLKVGSRMVILTGDGHYQSVNYGYDFSSSGGAKFPVFNCAGTNVSPPTSGPGPMDIGPFVNRYSYGVVEVADTGGPTVGITFRAFVVDNTTGAETEFITYAFATGWPQRPPVSRMDPVSAVYYWDGAAWRAGTVSERGTAWDQASILVAAS